MAIWDVLNEAGNRLGLLARPNKQTVFGLKDGFPIQLSIGRDGKNTIVLGLVRYEDSQRDAVLEETLKSSSEVAQNGLKLKNFEPKGGMLVVKMPPVFFGLPKPEKVADCMEAVLRTMKSVVAAPKPVCVICKLGAAPEPVLLNGMVSRVCPGCLLKIDEEARAAEEAYDVRDMNLPLALLSAAALAAIGALLWGGIIILTNHMFWIAAIGIGVMVGVGTVKAAGKGGWLVQVIAMTFTLFSVLAGLLVFIGHDVQQDALKRGMTVNWGVFLKRAPSILIALGGDTLFALGGGLLGALRAAKVAKRPNLRIKVER